MMVKTIEIHICSRAFMIGNWSWWDSLCSQSTTELFVVAGRYICLADSYNVAVWKNMLINFFFFLIGKSTTL